MEVGGGKRGAIAAAAADDRRVLCRCFVVRSPLVVTMYYILFFCGECGELPLRMVWYGTIQYVWYLL